MTEADLQFAIMGYISVCLKRKNQLSRHEEVFAKFSNELYDPDETQEILILASQVFE